MPDEMEPTAWSPDPPGPSDAVTWGPLRGILGSLAGLAVAVLALVALPAVAKLVTLPANLVLAGLPLLLPGACGGIAITWQYRCSSWRRVLAAVGPAVSFALALAATFLVLVGFQYHADWVGYFIGSGLVFAVAGAIAAACLAPALRLGCLRAGAGLVLMGAVAFMIGGAAHGALVGIALSGPPGPGASLLAIPLGFMVALVCGWGGLGGAAQRLQARSRRAR
jgi:hypothetical protein